MLLASMATAQEKFKALLTNDFAPWLKSRDFKRRDTTFRRRRDGAWQIVNFQRSKYSHASSVPFTVNLGVGLDLLHDDPPWRSRGWPLEHECDFKQRIGNLHKGEDHWWKVRPYRPTRRIVTDVLAALDKGLIWLDSHADPRALLEWAAHHPSKVTAFNLGSFVALAKKVGTDTQVEIAEAELRRWQQGERLAF